MKDTNKFYLECACASHTVLFEQFFDDGELNISYKVDAFSFKQDGILRQLWNRMQLIWFILWRGEALLYDVFISEPETVRRFKKWVSEIRDDSDEIK